MSRMQESSRSTTAVNQHWTTPPAVLDRIRAWKPILLDPCANVNSRCGAVNFLGPGEDSLDGLRTPWTSVKGATDHGNLVFVNPPFEDAGAWMGKCRAEAEQGVHSIMLVPHRSDTKVWQTHVRGGVRYVVNLASRLRYGGLSAYQRDRVEEFRKEFWSKRVSVDTMRPSERKHTLQDLEAREKSFVNKLLREGPPPEPGENIFNMGTSQFPSVLLDFCPPDRERKDGFVQHFGGDPSFGFVTLVCYGGST